MDSSDALVQATEGYVKQLALELDVSIGRMYELLSKDNPYPKTWRILRAIGRLHPGRLRILQADFNSRCEEIFSDRPTRISDATLHEELSEAIQASLAKMPAEAQRRELIEAVSVCQHRLDELNALN